MHHLTPAAFARKVGVRSRTTIHRYIKGKQFPTPEILCKIERETQGLVTKDDFERHKKANDNLPDFPWSRKDLEEIQECELAYRRMMSQRKEGERLSPQLRRAVFVLGDRIKMDKHQRNFFLDGRPVGAKELVVIANRYLKSHNLNHILYPGI